MCGGCLFVIKSKYVFVKCNLTCKTTLGGKKIFTRNFLSNLGDKFLFLFLKKRRRRNFIFHPGRVKLKIGKTKYSKTNIQKYYYIKD